MELPKCVNYGTEYGDPAGGFVEGPGLLVNWQPGPVAEVGRVGAMIEDLLLAVINRLKFYQTSRFNCEENDKAIACCLEALDHLNDRTEKRKARNVEGHYIV